LKDLQGPSREARDARETIAVSDASRGNSSHNCKSAFASRGVYTSSNSEETDYLKTVKPRILD
jgi:hypothetical protein